MTKLLFRTLPDFYPRTSAYAHFPFMDPKFMKKHLESSGKQALASKYDWRRPALPRPTHIIATQREAAHIIGSPTVYASAADQRLQAIIGGEIPEYVSVREQSTRCGIQADVPRVGGSGCFGNQRISSG